MNENLNMHFEDYSVMQGKTIKFCERNAIATVTPQRLLWKASVCSVASILSTRITYI